MNPTYKHRIPVQIRFNDIDRLNHVNNACYHSFFELGRVKYFNEILNRNFDWTKNGFVLARTEIDHIHPIFLNDEVYCYTKVIKLGTKSLTVGNVISKIVDGNIIECAKGIGVLVAMDYITNSSITIPELWSKNIEDFENN